MSIFEPDDPAFLQNPYPVYQHLLAETPTFYHEDSQLWFFTRHHDVDAVVFGYELGQVPGMPAAYPADKRLREIARGAIAALGEVNVREGMIATGDAFMADPDRVAATRAQFPSMLAVEMEGAAIAQTCYLYDCPFVVIRALSDIPGSGDNHLSFEQFLDTAADHSSRMVDQMLLTLGQQ